MMESMRELQGLVRSGYSDWGLLGDVSVKEKDGLLLFNYAVPAVMANRWNWLERVSRGLILDAKTGDVIARPFDKFFNWGESGRTTDAPIHSVTEKLDGSMGILYWRNGWKVATRGSFDSDQARWATEWFNRQNVWMPEAWRTMTVLFEIIYPENRIVVDYGQRAGLAVLAIRRISDGAYYPLWRRWAEAKGFALPQQHFFNTPAQIADFCATLDANNEGFVAEFADGQRFKFKGAAYVELHRLISGLTFSRAVEAVASGQIAAVRELVPDELLAQWNGWVAEIEEKAQHIQAEVERAFVRAPKDDRKGYALWVRDNVPSLAPYMFSRLDGREYMSLVYRREF